MPARVSTGHARLGRGDELDVLWRDGGRAVTASTPERRVVTDVDADPGGAEPVEDRDSLRSLPDTS